MKRITDKFGRDAEQTARGKESHVSDVIGCEVKAYCRMMKFPRKITKQTIGLMVFGIVAENVLAWTYPRDCRQVKSTIKAVKEEETVFGHIDLLEDLKNPFEVKASRKRIFRREQIPKKWLKQLNCYMAMEGADKGWIVIFNVFSCQIMAFQVLMTEKDRLAQLVLMTSKANKIKKAVDASDPSRLEVNGEEYEFCYYKASCPKVEECRNKWDEFKKQKK